jgi:SAM-dependent methyltransferase
VPHWFERVATHLGGAYLRYSFTKGTAQEVRFLTETLAIQPPMKLLDIGCGPGRHAHAFAEQGVDVVGIDISERFVELATERGVPRSRFIRGDARRLPIREGSFDLAISLCQGGFGLVPGEDGGVVQQIAAALRPGGRAVLSAFSSYFAVRFVEETDNFDADAGVNHELATVKDESGVDAQFDLWTSCFTPRELRLIARQSGLLVDAIWAVTPGGYAKNPPDIEHPEFLLLATKPPKAG